MKKTIFIGFLLGMLSGCYTQFSTLEEKIPPAPKVTYEIDSATGDTVKVYNRADTLVKAPNQTCYWTRNLWGEPELRCDNSYYSQDWYLYNDYPWWYNRDPYMYDAYGRCPQYYYYDGSCGRCRYYSDRGNYYNGSGWGGGSGRTSSGAPSKSGSKHTRSSGVPNISNINSSTNANLPKTGTNAVNQGSSGTPSSSQAAQTDQSRRTRSSAVPSSATIQESAPSPIYQTSVPESRTEAQAPVSSPPPPASQPAPPPPDQSNTNVQSSPPPSQPSNNGGDQNSNNHNRRNPRSW